MKLIREKSFDNFVEGKNEILDILPIHTLLYVELDQTKEESINKEQDIIISTNDIDLQITKDLRFILTFKTDQFFYLSRLFNLKEWSINYEQSMGLTSRDLNMILNT